MSKFSDNFEHKFEEDWKKSFPNTFVYRLHDQVSGYKVVSRNISDYICFKSPYLFIIEIKTIKGGTFPLNNLTQYEDMLRYSKGIKDVVAGTVIWFYEKDIVVFVPISSFEKLKEDGKKSFNVKYIDSGEYDCLKLDSVKKRVYMDTDYSDLYRYVKER